MKTPLEMRKQAEATEQLLQYSAVDRNSNTFKTLHEMVGYVMILADKILSKDQTVENNQQSKVETETVEEVPSARDYIESVYGTRTLARAIDCKDAESIMDLIQDYGDYLVDWQKKQQEGKP